MAEKRARGFRIFGGKPVPATGGAEATRLSRWDPGWAFRGGNARRDWALPEIQEPDAGLLSNSAAVPGTDRKAPIPGAEFAALEHDQKKHVLAKGMDTGSPEKSCENK